MIIGSIVVFSLVIENYLSGRFFNRVTQSVAVTAVIAAGQALVIITRNIDLSVGSIAGVSAYLTGDVLGDHLATTPVVAVLLAVAIGTLLGLINGLLVAYGRIPSIIVTLGTLAIYRTWLISYAEARDDHGRAAAAMARRPPRSTVFTIGDYEFRTMFVMAIVVIVVLQVLRLESVPDESSTPSDPTRRLPSSPGYRCGARRSPPSRRAEHWLVSAGSSCWRVLARSPCPPGGASSWESIAAAVVGGVSTLGGSGTIVGSLFGAVLIGLLDQSIGRVPQISEFVRDAVLGLLILLAVVLDGLLARRFVHRRTIMAMGTSTPPAPTDTTDGSRSRRRFRGGR